MKLLLSVFLIFASLQFAVSQSFNGGFLVGLSASQIGGDLRGGYHKAGVMTGIYIDRSFKKDWRWGFEMYYIGKGSSSSIKTAYGTINEFTNSLHYIEMPFFLKYAGIDKFTFSGGLGVSYFLTAKFTSYGLELPSNVYDMRQYDFAPMWMVDYQINKKLSSDLRFFYSSRSAADNIRWYNNTLTIALRYKLK